MALCQGLMMSANSALIASAALIGHALLGSDKTLAALPIALQFLATMATSVPASLLMGRIGRRAGFMLASSVGMAGAALGAYAVANGSFALFCAATACIGVFNGFAIYYRFAAADGSEAEHRSKAISYVLAGGVIAAFIGPNLASWTRALLPGAFFVGTMLALVTIYFVSFALQSLLRAPPSAQPVRATAGRALVVIARQPRFVVAVICGVLGYATMTVVMTATPLAMHAVDYPFSDTAFVIQWHVFAMFAPSFVTGHLINRFGVLSILLAGTLLEAASVTVNLLGAALWNYTAALVLLGLGWNFLFVGATTLLTETYRAEERAKTQGVNDFAVFTATTLGAVSAGALQHALGWQSVNLGVVPLLAIILGAIVWLRFAPAAQRA